MKSNDAVRGVNSANETSRDSNLKRNLLSLIHCLALGGHLVKSSKARKVAELTTTISLQQRIVFAIFLFETNDTSSVLFSPFFRNGIPVFFVRTVYNHDSLGWLLNNRQGFPNQASGKDITRRSSCQVFLANAIVMYEN